MHVRQAVSASLEGLVRTVVLLILGSNFVNVTITTVAVVGVRCSYAQRYFTALRIQCFFPIAVCTRQAFRSSGVAEVNAICCRECDGVTN